MLPRESGLNLRVASRTIEMLAIKNQITIATWAMNVT
jgi:hypothetical protein